MADTIEPSGPRARLTVLAAVLALGACHAPATPDNAAAPDNIAAGNTVARVLALPEGQLHIVLFRAIRDAGQECQDLTASKRLGEIDGSPAWFATCDNRTHFLVVIGPDGIAQVTDARKVRGIRK